MKSYKSMWLQQEVDHKGSRGCDTFDVTENNFQTQWEEELQEIWKDNGKIQERRWFPLLITHGICHLSHFYGFAVLEHRRWLKCVRIMNLVWEEKVGEKKTRRREDLARRPGWREEGIVLVWSVYVNQMMKTPSRDRRLICDDDSEPIRSTAKAKKHQRKLTYWLDILATQIKSPVAAIGRRWTAVISKSCSREAFLCESCIPLQTTHTLTFAHRSARKEIPEAHFQFMQNHHGKTDSFQFN